MCMTVTQNKKMFKFTCNIFWSFTRKKMRETWSKCMLSNVKWAIINNTITSTYINIHVGTHKYVLTTFQTYRYLQLCNVKGNKNYYSKKANDCTMIFFLLSWILRNLVTHWHLGWEMKMDWFFHNLTSFSTMIWQELKMTNKLDSHIRINTKTCNLVR